MDSVETRTIGRERHNIFDNIEDTDHEKGRESSALVRSIDTSALPRTVHAVALSSSISGREVFKRCLGVSLDGLATLLPVGRANFAVLLL